MGFLILHDSKLHTMQLTQLDTIHALTCKRTGCREDLVTPQPRNETMQHGGPYTNLQPPRELKDPSEKVFCVV